MGACNPAFDAYIEKAAPFAQPILTHLRNLVHSACPEVVEVMKWSNPHFDYKGEMMCAMSGYKQHCTFHFWKSTLLSHPKLKENSELEAADRYLGKITSLNELPPDAELIALIKEAMLLNEQGVKIAKPKPAPLKEVEVPDYLAVALNGNPAARAVFDSKSASFRKEYINWIVDAKSDATRQKRMEEALEWMADGKGRYWKYSK